MAQKPEEDKNASGITRAGKRKWGYDVSQVDAFLERAHTLYDSDDDQLTQQDIQNVSFDLCKNGYVISQVDAALARLERAVVDKQTAREIAQDGRVAWKAQTEEMYRSISRHASRAAKERFRAGDKKAPSYDRKQVDRLVDQIVDKAAAELGVDGVTKDDVSKLDNLNSTSVANVIFTQRKGKKGYDERQVDNYLNACMRLLSRLESYARVADYVNEGDDVSKYAASAPSSATSSVTSLFPDTSSSPATQAMPQSFAFAPARETPSASDFDALSKAEQEIFSSPASAQSMPSALSTPKPSPASFAPAASMSAPSAASTAASAMSAPASAPSSVFASASDVPPSFAPASTASASAVSADGTGTSEPSPTETAAWTPDFDSMSPVSVPSTPAASATPPYGAPSYSSYGATTPATTSTSAYAPSTSVPSASASSTSAYTPAGSSASSYTPSYTSPSPNSTGFTDTPSAANTPSMPSMSTPSTSSMWSSTPSSGASVESTPTSSLSPLAQMTDSSTASASSQKTSAAESPLNTPSTPTLGPVDIPDLSFPSFDFDSSTPSTKKTQE